MKIIFHHHEAVLTSSAGAGIHGWNFKRKLISRCANFLGTKENKKENLFFLKFKKKVKSERVGTEGVQVSARCMYTPNVSSFFFVFVDVVAAQLLLNPGVSDLTGSFR